MPEAVIVATARSPIGRANKGSLVSLRTDEMAAQIVRALMAKVPSVKGSDIEDLIIGVGQPAGEAGFNLAMLGWAISGFLIFFGAFTIEKDSTTVESALLGTELLDPEQYQEARRMSAQFPPQEIREK